jgi:hypothetical protein
VLSVGRIRWVVQKAMRTPSPCGLRLLNCSDTGGHSDASSGRPDGCPFASLLVLSNFSLCPREHKPLVSTLKNGLVSLVKGVGSYADV